MNDLTVYGGGSGVATFTNGVNSFEACFRPARPALDAVVALRKPLTWVSKYRRPLLDVARASLHRDEAVMRCVTIPKDAEMYRCRKLFEEAEREPAPIEWTNVAIALMLDSEPGGQHVSDSYRNGVIDGIYQDPEVWAGYEPGFSAPVIARAVREVRRRGGLPSASGFIAACIRNREWFRRGQTRIDDLIQLRQNSEDILIELGDPRRLELAFDESDEDFD